MFLNVVAIHVSVLVFLFSEHDNVCLLSWYCLEPTSDLGLEPMMTMMVVMMLVIDVMFHTPVQATCLLGTSNGPTLSSLYRDSF